MVTGFLGPNGAGKSTTMRMIAGLDEPSTGRVIANGGDYRFAAAPMAELGVLLEANAVHTGRSARNHLLALAHTNGISRRRVNQVIEIVGLAQVAGKRLGRFSLGMGQRLGVASALLGNPRSIVLDEPVNGLDPEGVLHRVPIFELTVRQASLEEAFMTLTSDSVDYCSTGATDTAAVAA